VSTLTALHSVLPSYYMALRLWPKYTVSIITTLSFLISKIYSSILIKLELGDVGVSRGGKIGESSEKPSE